MKNINPIRLDPTRSAMDRNAFIADMARRCAMLRRAIHTLVVEEDAFGITAAAAREARAEAQPGGMASTLRTIPMDMVFNTRWQFETDEKKVAAYQEWFKNEVKAGLLEVDPLNQDTPWLSTNIKSAYKKGALRAYQEANTKNGSPLDIVEGGKKQFMKDAFDGPVAEGKMRALYTRSFTQLKGVTAQMDADMSRILAQGLAQGKSAASVARDLENNVSGLEKRRCRTIARTEIVYAHNEGKLDSFEAMNLEGVGVMAEWSTAHDGLVCPICQPLEGVVLTIKEARGTLPRHPNCITGDMRVVAPEAVALLKTNYTGEIIEFVTVGGRRITVTPAHVLLTEYGFARAEAVHHGLNLVVDTGLYGGVEAPDYENDVPTIAEEFVTATETQGRRPVSVPTAPEHLHNEGRFCDKKIDIILADSILGKKRQTHLGKPYTHDMLPLCGGGVGGLALGTFAQILFRAAHTSDGSMGTCRDALAFLLGGVLEAEQIRLGATTGTLPNIGQAFLDDVTVNTKTLRHCLDRHPLLKKLHNFFGGDLGAVLAGSVHDLATRLIEAGFDGIPLDAVMFGDTVDGPPVVQVQYDKVLSVRKFHVDSLPVYDVQTRSTAYSVGGVITSNCRCAWIPANVGEHKGGTTKTTWSGPEQGLEAPGTLPTGKTTGQKFSQGETSFAFRKSIQDEFPKLDIKKARTKTKWVGADKTITGKINPGSKKALAAKAEEAAKKKTAKEAAAKAAEAQAQKAAKAEAHSAKVKLGLTKKKYGLDDTLLEITPDGTPRLSVDGLFNYIEKKGVQLTPDEQNLVIFVKPKPGQSILTAQMERLDEMIAAKAAQAAELEKAAQAAAKATQQAAELKAAQEAKAAAAKAAEEATKAAQAAADAAKAGTAKMDDAVKAFKKWDTAPDVQVLDAADYSSIPGWEAAVAKKQQSYGMVIFDEQGRVLLREPTNHFSGTHWTFAKGGGTPPGTTTLLEVGEEVGHIPAIHDIIPGSFKGGTTTTNYFVGKSVGYNAALMDTETQAVKWATYDEAVALINQTTNAAARVRDLKVLDAAYGVMKNSDGTEFAALVKSGQTALDATKAKAQSIVASNKTKLGAAKTHYAKPKFGGGVGPEDWTNPANPTKLNTTGLNKVLSEKGWHMSTLPPDVVDGLDKAADVVGQKEIIDGLKKAPKGVSIPSEVPAPTPATTPWAVKAADFKNKDKVTLLEVDAAIYKGAKGSNKVIDEAFYPWAGGPGNAAGLSADETAALVNKFKTEFSHLYKADPTIAALPVKTGVKLEVGVDVSFNDIPVGPGYPAVTEADIVKALKKGYTGSAYEVDLLFDDFVAYSGMNHIDDAQVPNLYKIINAFKAQDVKANPDAWASAALAKTADATDPVIQKIVWAPEDINPNGSPKASAINKLLEDEGFTPELISKFKNELFDLAEGDPKNAQTVFDKLFHQYTVAPVKKAPAAVAPKITPAVAPVPKAFVPSVFKSGDYTTTGSIKVAVQKAKLAEHGFTNDEITAFIKDTKYKHDAGDIYPSAFNYHVEAKLKAKAASGAWPLNAPAKAPSIPHSTEFIEIPGPAQTHPADTYWADMLAAAKTVNYHAADGAYNKNTLDNYSKAISEMSAKMVKGNLDKDTKDMLTYYLNWADEIDKAKAAGTKFPEAYTTPQFTYQTKLKVPKVAWSPDEFMSNGVDVKISAVTKKIEALGFTPQEAIALSDGVYNEAGSLKNIPNVFDVFMGKTLAAKNAPSGEEHTLKIIPPTPKPAKLNNGDMVPINGGKFYGDVSFDFKTAEKLGGSTGAKKVMVTDSEGTSPWVMKDYSGRELQAENEFLANNLYNAIAPGTAPVSRIAYIKNRNGDTSAAVFNKFIDNSIEVGKTTGAARTTAEAKAREHFVLDAWLANWDAVGMSADNMVVVGEKVIRIDNGGALLFRAQGGLKGADFGPNVGELKSFFNKKLNPSAAALYDGIDDTALLKQIGQLEAAVYRNGGVAKLLDNAGIGNITDPEKRKEIADALEQRFHDLKSVRDTLLGKAKIPLNERTRRLPEVQVVKSNVNVYKTKGAANAALRKAAKQAPSKEIEDVVSFTGGGYTSINKAHLKAAETGKIGSKTVSNINKGLAKLPGFSGTVGRGHNFVVPEHWDKWKRGDWAQVWWTCPASSSANPERVFTSGSDGVCFIIRTKGERNAYVQDISNYSSEHEAMFMGDSAFRVVGWAESDTAIAGKHRRFIVMDEIGVDEVAPETQIAPPQLDAKELWTAFESDATRAEMLVNPSYGGGVDKPGVNDIIEKAHNKGVK